MFNVIVDSKIAETRERAQQGNIDSMVLLATYLRKGWHTRQDHELAMKIFEHVLADREKIPFPETRWNALAQKAYIHFARGEEDVVDVLFIDLIRDMVTHPVEQWEFDKLEEVIGWLRERIEIKKSEATE